MDKLLDPMSWPLWVVVAGMILAAVIDGWKYRVPNWLTFSLVLSGWTLGLVHTLGGQPDGWQAADGTQLTGVGSIWASLGCTFLGFALLFPFLLIRAMGKGDVKMQMGFGAWVGAFFGWSPGWLYVLLAFCVAAIIGGIIGAGMMIYNRTYRQNAQNMQLILMDVVVGAGMGRMAERGQQLRDRGPKLPYGIPLCLGFVGCLAYVVMYLNP